MHFKLIIALTEDSITNKIVDAARSRGATGSTVIHSARGEGLQAAKTFFGLDLETQRDVVLLLVEEHMSRQIIERIAEVGNFEKEPGSGIAFVLDIEDAVGLTSQIATIESEIEDQI